MTDPKMIKPSALHPGGTIGVVSPSKWAEPVKLERAGQVLEEAGYRILWGESSQAREHQYAGSPELRAKDLEAMFINPDVDAIFCARGGYGAFRVGDRLDYKLIQEHPKIFMGFSDITTLLLSITQKTSLITFHGPMLHTFFKGLEQLSFSYLKSVLSGQGRSIALSDIPNVTVLREGKATGELWGGNMYLSLARAGTPTQLDTEGKVLFLEDVNEPYHKLETMFQQLRRGGLLDSISGLIIGEILDIPEEEIPFGISVEDIIMEACEGLDIPIVSGVPCGHGSSILTFPISLPVSLTVSHKQVTLDFMESPVEDPTAT
ncbi:LD-carboxypeptidase [Candidatus Neomarinimicrobiota bacterium]